MSETSQTVTAHLDIAPAALFAALARPATHLATDGSGMLRGLTPQTPDEITSVGQVFSMLMAAEDGRKYSVDNHVTSFEPDQTIAWMPARSGAEPIGVEWSWTFVPAGDGTDVAVTCDWSRVTSEEYLARFTLPRVSADKVRATIEAVAESCERA